MTIEITNLEDFKGKFAHLMAANVNMISAGAPPSASLVSKMIDEFLPQFYVCTPAPAVPKSAGFVVVTADAGYIPFDFRGKTYETLPDAHLAVTRFLSTKDYGKPSDYRIVEATYFG